MLRRPPTAIQLTSEDLAMYEDAKAEAATAAQPAVSRGRQENRNSDGKVDPNDELKPLPGDRVRGQGGRTREERIGLGR